MLKNAYFLEKYCKNCLSVGGSASELRVVTPIYYYDFVEFVSSVKCVSLPEKNDSSACSAFSSYALLLLFFTSNSADFMTGRERIFLAPGRKVP